MTKSKSLAFFGTEDFSLGALISLVDNGYEIAVVVTKPDAKRGRGKVMTPSAVKVFASTHDIEIVQDNDMSVVEEKLKQYPTEIAVLSAFGRVIPDSIINLYSKGIVNIHPSLLPRWRGASPIEQTILAADRETGVSIMRLVKEMDAGPVYAQKKIELSGRENSIDLYESLGALGASLLVGKLPEILQGTIRPKPQDEAAATLAPMITKQDGEINWKMSAKEIDRKIRAYIRWPGVKSTFGEVEAKIIEASPSEQHSAPGEMNQTPDGILVGCGTGSLMVSKLQPLGKREMTVQEFLAGNKI